MRRWHDEALSRTVIALGLLLACGISATSFAQDYDFDIPEEEEKRIEFSGNLDAKWGLLRANMDSPIYGLQFSQTPAKDDYLSQYRLDFYLNGEYRHQQVGFTLKTFYQYVKEEPLPPSIFELHGSLNLSHRSTAGIGKRRFNWGKGYAFNPVGYVNAQKDPENPDLALAGKTSAYFNYNRSFGDKPLQNLSLSSIVLAPEAEVNNKFAAADDIAVAAKLYFLYRNIDIDFMTLQANNLPTRYGLDFAANLLSNLEIHGEFSYARREDQVIVENNSAVVKMRNGGSYLFGLRYLSALNTTLIAEYYHNNAGLTQNEFVGILDHLDGSLLTEDAAAIASARNSLPTFFQSRNLMRDYLYVKLSRPEPFSWLYTSVSVFTIYNLVDNSFLLSPQFGYKPFTNSEILLWPTLFFGGDDTEYGAKQFQHRVEVWLRFFF